MIEPRIELLYFDGCPGHSQLLPIVRRIAEEGGAVLVKQRVETHAEAIRRRFLGSPSVRVNDEDVERGAGARDDFGVKCRIYRHEGVQSSTPPKAWIAEALHRAA